MTFNPDKLKSPVFIFIIYILASSLVIMVFRFIFPGSDAPLVIYTGSWRIIQGALLLFNMFPALALSALVIPFGIASGYEEPSSSFSDIFFKKLSVSVIIAVAAAVIYGVIFFFALPAVKNKEENMRYTGEIYRLAKQNMQESKARGEWQEAAGFLAMCEKIWYNNPDLNNDKKEIENKIAELGNREREEERAARAARADNARSGSARSAGMTALDGGSLPGTAAEVLVIAQTALKDENYFDAHWLANLANRLAIENNPGSPEVAESARLASDAWNKISSLAPNQRETEQYKIFALKLEGYNAMNNNEYIRAYYIFQELIKLNPLDPDAKNFIAKSEQGAKETAFFIDEIEFSLDNSLAGAVYSLPGSGGGRCVLRFSNLTAKDDVAYGIDFEYMSFDDLSRRLLSLKSRYAKLTPVIIDNRPQIMVLMHALDRNDEDTSYDCEVLFGNKTEIGLFIDITYEELLLISEVRMGLTNLQMDRLFEAANKLNNFGYVHEIFQAEILSRFGTALFFLPAAITVIVIGWRYRAKQRPRYLFAAMLFVMPVVFNGFVFLYRSIINILGIYLVLNMGFAGALTIYIIALAASLFGSLIALAAQHT